MKKPTISDVLQILEDSTGNEYENINLISSAEKIHALFSPPMKPLSELINDIPSLEKIFSRATRAKSQLWHTLENNKVCASGSGFTLNIYYDGHLTLHYHGGLHRFECSMFELIDLVRSLGYDISSERVTERES